MNMKNLPLKVGVASACAGRWEDMGGDHHGKNNNPKPRNSSTRQKVKLHLPF